MNTKLIGDVFCSVFEEYAVRESAVTMVQGNLLLEAVALDLPLLLIVGEPGVRVAMVRCVDGEKQTLCFLEFNGEPDSLWGFMQPNEVGWNRVMQKSWNLGFSTESEAVTGTFIGKYPEDGSMGIILKGECIRFYLEVLSTAADESQYDRKHDTPTELLPSP